MEGIERAANRKPLTEAEARAVMRIIMAGEASDAQIAGLLVALRMKGETAGEITGFARAMRECVVPVHCSRKNLVDTCGTGGDSIKTFNLSTAAAIIASAAGAPVAKHGNRAVTSKCGSADVLEAAGINLNITPEKAAQLLDDIGLAFLFAPNYHPAMKHAIGPRREMRLRTVFNILGPLTNPAGATRQLIGVYSSKLVPKMASALKKLGCKRGIVAHGVDGLDEISPIGFTRLAIIENGSIETRLVRAEDFGIRLPSLAAISCSETVEEHLTKLQIAISDEASDECNAVLPSASGAIWVAGLAKDFPEGVEMARAAVSSGKASAKLRELAGASA